MLPHLIKFGIICYERIPHINIISAISTDLTNL